MKYSIFSLWVALLSVSNILLAQAPSEEVFLVNDLLIQAKQLGVKDSAVFLVEEALEISLNEQYEDGTIQAYQLLADLYDDQ
ncbi:MAG: hypothetical protein AAFP82_04815, partial [Bacteroidota bacterium]